MARFEEFKGAHERAKALEQSIRQRANKAVDELADKDLGAARTELVKANQKVENVRRLQDKLKLRTLETAPAATNEDDRVGRVKDITVLRGKLGIPATEGQPAQQPAKEYNPEESPAERSAGLKAQREANARRRADRAPSRTEDLRTMGDPSAPAPTAPGRKPTPAPKPVSDIPDNFAPDAIRKGAPARVTKNERKRVAKEAADRTAVAPASRKSGAKRGQTTTAIGEGRTETTDGGKRQQSARNAAYRAKKGMGTQQGAAAAVKGVNTRKVEKEVDTVKRTRRKLVADGVDASRAISIAKPRSAAEIGQLDEVHGKFTPEYHAAAVAQKMGIPVDHLHSFITTHPHLGKMTRPQALQALYSLGSENRKKDFGSAGTAEQGRAAFSQLAEGAKAHSRELHEKALQAAEGRNRGGRARAGHAATAAALEASKAGTGSMHPANESGAELMKTRLAQIDKKFNL